MAVWIRNVLVDTTRRRWRNRNGGPEQQLWWTFIPGKGREGQRSGERAIGAARCRQRYHPWRHATPVMYWNGRAPQNERGPPPLLPFQRLRLTATMLFWRLRCQEDLSLFAAPSTGTIGGPGRKGVPAKPPSPLQTPPLPLPIHPRPPIPPSPPPPIPRHDDRPAPPGPQTRPGVHCMHGRPICRVVGTAIERPPGGL